MYRSSSAFNIFLCLPTLRFYLFSLNIIQIEICKEFSWHCVNKLNMLILIYTIFRAKHQFFSIFRLWSEIILELIIVQQLIYLIQKNRQVLWFLFFNILSKTCITKILITLQIWHRSRRVEAKGLFLPSNIKNFSILST